MTLFCFFGLVNLAFDATDEGVRFCLEPANGEGVSQSCPPLNPFLLFGVSAMMAGRYFQTALSVRLIRGQRQWRRLYCRSAVNWFCGVYSRSVLGASVGAPASLQGQQPIAAIGLVTCHVGWSCCPLLVP